VRLEERHGHYTQGKKKTAKNKTSRKKQKQLQKPKHLYQIKRGKIGTHKIFDSYSLLKKKVHSPVKNAQTEKTTKCE